MTRHRPVSARLPGLGLAAVIGLMGLLAWERVPQHVDPGLTSLITTAAQRPCSDVEVIGLRGHRDPLDQWDGAGADVQHLTQLLRPRVESGTTVELFGFPYPQAGDVLGLPLRVPRTVPSSAQLLVTYVERRHRACGSTRLVVIGQSEGAAVAHWAYPEIVDRITAMVLLGDPLHRPSASYSVDLGNRYYGQLLFSPTFDFLSVRFRDRISGGNPRVRSYCLPHDPVCGFNPLDRHPSTHLEYRNNPPGAQGGPGVLDQAADFVVQALSIRS